LFFILPNQQTIPVRHVFQFPDTACIALPSRRERKMSGGNLSDRWFYKVENVKRGPISANDLRDKIIKQELPIESPVWREGMDSWASARQVGALFPDGFVPIYTGKADSPSQQLSWKRPVLYGCAGIAFLGLAGAQLFSGSGADPYTYQRVSGDILYEDGQVIPAKTLQLTFIPLTPPINPRLHPRPGFASIDTQTGAFKAATSRTPSDGILQGTHKVLVNGENRMPLPEDVVPAEYATFSTTPLQVDAGTGTFHLKVKRPMPAAKKADPKPMKAVLP
jgi:GYF domain 2